MPNAWESAPVADSGKSSGPAWMSAPIADDKPVKKKAGVLDTIGSGLKQNYEDFMSAPREAAADLGKTADRVIGTRVRKIAKGDFSGTAKPGEYQGAVDMKDAIDLGLAGVNYLSSGLTGAARVARRPITRAANNALVDSGRVMPTIGLEKGSGLLPKVTVDANIDREQSGRNLDNTVGAIGGLASMFVGNESGVPNALAKASKPVRAAKATKGPIIPLEDLQTAKQAAYKSVSDAGVRYNPQAVDEMASNIAKDAIANNISQIRHPKAYSMMQDIEALKGTSPSLTEIDQLRQVIRRDVASSKDEAEAFFGKRMINELDKFVDSAGPQHVVTGSAADAPKLLKAAREANTKYRKTEAVTDAVESAKLRAGSTGSGGNVNNAIRQNLRQVMEKTPNLTDAEREALRNVVVGGKMQNFLRQVGKLSPEGNGLMLGGQLAAAIPTHGLSGITALAGAGSKFAADRMTIAGVDDVLRVISNPNPTVTQIQQAQVKISKMPRGPLSSALQKAVVANASKNAANDLSSAAQHMKLPAYNPSAAAEDDENQ